MRIGEVAIRAGVSVQAVRLYERIGILKKTRRLPSGYRDYSIETVTVIRFIKRAQNQGFTLEEIRTLVQLRGQNSSAATRIRALARNKLAQLDEKISRLQAQRDAIEHGLNACRCSEPFPLCMFAKLTGAMTN